MAEPYEGAHPTDNPDIWENENGFWFVDASEELNGPYVNAQDAVIALNAYVNWLNQPKAVNAVNATANLPQCNVKYYGG
jgi:hypothetical protein